MHSLSYAMLYPYPYCPLAQAGEREATATARGTAIVRGQLWHTLCYAFSKAKQCQRFKLIIIKLIRCKGEDSK